MPGTHSLPSRSASPASAYASRRPDDPRRDTTDPSTSNKPLLTGDSLHRQVPKLLPRGARPQRREDGDAAGCHRRHQVAGTERLAKNAE